MDLKKKFMRLVNSNFKSVGTAVLSYEPQGSMPTMEKARAAEQVGNRQMI